MRKDKLGFKNYLETINEENESQSNLTLMHKVPSEQNFEYKVSNNS